MATAILDISTLVPTQTNKMRLRPRLEIIQVTNNIVMFLWYQAYVT